jgi:hypothetical protein
MWKCKNCGEVIDDNFQICWSCGASLEGYVLEGFQPEDEEEAMQKEK